MTLLVAAVAVLGIVTALNLFLLLGVVRRLRELPTAPGGAMLEPGLPTPGHRVGEFQEITMAGAQLTHERIRTGRSLVVFLSPNCQPCQVVADRLAEQPAGSLPPTLLFVHADAGDPKFVELRGKVAALGELALIGGHSSAAAAFGGVDGYPTTILVDDGVVVAASMLFNEVLETAKGELLAL